ncbi:MAG: proteobacterial dedicated sortase system histidine kinase, partial [Gammaproteobacteria bacterium]|nr:proteobacterial dedicated sortase system histidine kinase [Gammaproteobacteria bacterium]
SEATRLEQALQSADKKQVNISELIQLCVEGYRSAYSDVHFKTKLPDQSLMKNVAADLIVQMLDKLVKNAMDFKRGDDPVIIELITRPDLWGI